MTLWAHKQKEQSRLQVDEKAKRTGEELAPPKDWMDAFLLRRITADPNIPKEKNHSVSPTGWLTGASNPERIDGPNNLDSCRHLINRIETYLRSNASDTEKLECLDRLLELIKGAQERESRKCTMPGGHTIAELSKVVKQNFMDLARYSAAHSGRTRLAFETSDTLELARNVLFRFRASA